MVSSLGAFEKSKIACKMWLQGHFCPRHNVLIKNKKIMKVVKDENWGNKMKKNSFFLN